MLNNLRPKVVYFHGGGGGGVFFARSFLFKVYSLIDMEYLDHVWRVAGCSVDGIKKHLPGITQSNTGYRHFGNKIPSVCIFYFIYPLMCSSLCNLSRRNSFLHRARPSFRKNTILWEIGLGLGRIGIVWLFCTD